MASSTVEAQMDPFPECFHNLVDYLWANCGNFQGYRLSKSFHSFMTMLVYPRFQIALEKENTWCQIWRVCRPTNVTT